MKLPDATDTPITLDPQDIVNASDWEDFVSLWMISKEIDVKNQWYKGDIADRVAIIHGESSLTKFAEEVKESPRTMEHYRRVARAFPEKTRGWNLTWTHYLIASFSDSYKKGTNKFDSNNRFTWIEQAHDNNWSTARLQAEIKKKHIMGDSLDYFQYYFEYINKVRNVLTHVEKDKMTDDQRHKLVENLLDTYNNVMVYLEGK